MKPAIGAGLCRRSFLRATACFAGGWTLREASASTVNRANPAATGRMTADELPRGAAPMPVAFPHFPTRLHAFVWRNWQLVPLERLAAVSGATSAQIQRMGQAMGLPPPPRITPDQLRRSFITILKRNWHLLPYQQLLELLEWTPEQLDYTLREDDFLFIKLGRLKPECAPIRYQSPDAETEARERQIARIVSTVFPDGVAPMRDPLFGFVTELSARVDWPATPQATPADFRSRPRFCYSYFALYGDPLLETDADPYPDAYLAKLAAVGVNGVWLQAVLYRLAPFPWDPPQSRRWADRLKNLRQLVARAGRQGIGVWLYLNEPRAMPLDFFRERQHLRGVVEGDHATLCTSVPEVQDYLRASVSRICQEVPELAGFFTITASENLTNCWSHHQGAACPRCAQRGAAQVIAGVNTLVREGIRHAQAKTALIAWDWGWADAWAEDAIDRLPDDCALMSVSEWSLPIQRGGVPTTVGEYSISAVGPGPRATRHWARARQRGLRVLAKIQAGNTWELSAVPYIPAVANVARHASNLRQAAVDGIMLGWTLGGYPSPNLEAVAAVAAAADAEPGQLVADVLQQVARRRFGARLGPAMAEAWQIFSTAFSEFPYHGGVVYFAPLQVGPANLLWADPTGYGASMVGFPYDDLEAWRAVYPPDVFIAQLEKVADGFDRGLAPLESQTPAPTDLAHQAAFARECRVAEATAIHFRSVANQARFIVARRALASASTPEIAGRHLATLEGVLEAELDLARRLHDLQCVDSRLGFEASNHYFYIPLDLAEKVLNCRDLLDRWLPERRTR